MSCAETVLSCADSLPAHLPAVLSRADSLPERLNTVLSCADSLPEHLTKLLRHSAEVLWQFALWMRCKLLILG